jgi:CubicO group peptidase (beta-lactamase class C family)
MLKKLLILVVLLGIAYALAPAFIQKGLYHTFSNVTDYQIFENATVKHGKAEPWLKSAEYNQRTPDSKLLDTIKDNQTIAFLVIQNDSIQYENYWAGYGEKSLSGSFSMAKSVISMLMGIAIEEGKVKSVDDYVSNYIPELKREGTDTIKIKDLLTMSAGFKWTESYWNLFGKTADIYYGDRVRQVVGSLKADYAPGQKYYYSSAETQLIAWVIENAYGRSIPDLFSEKIWSKIGAENDALWSLDKKDGVAKAFCCLNSNARDFARLGKLVLQNGMWDSVQIVPSSYIKEATTADSWLMDENGNPVDFYGYQFWIINYKGMKIPYFRGVQGQMIYVIPDKNAVVVRLGEYVSQDKVNHHSVDTYTYLDAAFEVLK